MIRWGGSRFSLQVHPLTEYIQQEFGMHYTQDESYYLLDAKPDSCVYLGTRNGIDSQAMLADLAAAQRGEKPFDDERFINRFPARKHDHFLIPGWNRPLLWRGSHGARDQRHPLRHLQAVGLGPGRARRHSAPHPSGAWQQGDPVGSGY
ncbi:hypothetical protein ACTG15_01070 [Aeromonas sp. 164P]